MTKNKHTIYGQVCRYIISGVAAAIVINLISCNNCPIGIIVGKAALLFIYR